MQRADRRDTDGRRVPVSFPDPSGRSPDFILGGRHEDQRGHEQLIQNASFIQGQAEEYAEVYGSVYRLLQQMEGYWKGKDFLAFSEQLNAFRSDFELMKKVLIEYASYLRESAAVYARLQDECAAMASRLRC